MKIKESKDNIVLFVADNQYELASTFLRIQEFYESPEFKHTVFDLEEYMDWYASEFGNFTYYTDWNGFNVPGDMVRNFFEHFGDQLSRKEQVLYEMLQKYIEGDEKFYVIGVWKDTTVQHEFSHAFFYVDPGYKKEMLALLKNVPKEFKHHCHKVLQEDGYHPTVFHDESVAYMSTNTMPEFADMFKTDIPWTEILPLQLAFEKRYEKHNDEKS